MPIDESGIRRTLETIIDPQLGKGLVTLGLVEAIDVEPNRITLTISTEEAQPEANQPLETAIREAMTTMADLEGTPLPELVVTFARKVRLTEQSASAQENPLSNVRHVIAVGAGKGGVGKSTSAVMLALGLARSGARVGLLDGDIYGPSIPTMLGLDEEVVKVRGSTMIPFETHGIKSVSIGKLVDPDKALIWRGPMAHGAFKQLALQTDWGPLDYLLVDLPPGTGDVPLTLAQLLPLTGAVMVCTPQRVAQDDARRAARMFQQLEVEILGVIENMSSFTAEDGTVHDIFGEGGAEILAQTMGLPFLGRLPIHPAIRINLDEGTPDQCFTTDEKLTQSLEGLANGLASRVSILEHSRDATQPTLNIS